jgi:hypothetical protein
MRVSFRCLRSITNASKDYPNYYKNNVSATCVLRNYIIRQELATNLTVAEAMLATSATTHLFNPISIGKDFPTFDYISGDLGFSNPVREVIAGAHNAFGGERTMACLLSIGCGHSGVTSGQFHPDQLLASTFSREWLRTARKQPRKSLFNASAHNLLPILRQIWT